MEASKKQRVLVKSKISRRCENTAATSMNESHYELLPSEVLLKIFMFYVKTEGIFNMLRLLGGVCTRWKTVAMDSTLWQVVDVSERDEQQKNRFMQLCRKGALRKTKELDLRNLCKFLSTEELIKILTVCPELRSLKISRTTEAFKKVFFQELPQHCPGLSRFSISCVEKITQPWFDDIFTKIGPNIVQLSISETYFIGRTFMSQVGNNCCSIQELDLSNLDGPAICFPVEDLQEKCPNIRILRLTNTSFSIKPEPAAKISVSPGFLNLEEISLAMTSIKDSVSEQEFLRILGKCCKLKLLDIRGCVKLSPKSVILLPATDLKHIFISNTKLHQMGDPVVIMMKYKHSLREVDLSWYPCLDSLTSMLHQLAGVESPPLETLDLMGTKVTLPIVKEILDNCKQLRTLNLESCRSLGRGWKRNYSNDGIKELRQAIEKYLSTNSV